MQECWLKTPFSLTGKRVWVAGHSGMVGAALLRRLACENCEILTVSHDELDLRDQAAVKKWVNKNNPNIVVIAAATVGGIMANSKNPAKFFYDNIMIAANIIHSSYETGVEKLLFLGSSCIYPREAKQPIEESELLSGKLESTNEAYALAKIGGLKMAKYYREQYGCDFISAMPCNLYGVGDRYDEQSSHVIPALIMKAHKAKAAGANSLTVWGSGRALREFLYVDDLAGALVFLLQNYSFSDHINIGSGQEVKIKHLIDIVCDIVGYDGEIIFDISKPDGMPRKLLDSSVLAKSGWKPSISLKDGIRKAYKDYLARYDVSYD